MRRRDLGRSNLPPVSKWKGTQRTGIVKLKVNYMLYIFIFIVIVTYLIIRYEYM